MASITWSFAYNSGSVDYYYYTLNYTSSDVPYPSGSTNRRTSPASGYTSPSPLACGTTLTFSVNYFYRISGNNTEQSGSFDITGTAPSCPPPPPTYPPSWSDNTIGQFEVGSSYSDSVSATNMQFSGTYSVFSGSLPAGITFNNGAFSGTPTTAGSYDFTIRAQNSYGSITQQFTGTVYVSPSLGLAKIRVGTQWQAVTAVKVLDDDNETWLDGTVKYTTDGTNWSTSS